MTSARRYPGRSRHPGIQRRPGTGPAFQSGFACTPAASAAAGIQSFRIGLRSFSAHDLVLGLQALVVDLHRVRIPPFGAAVDPVLPIARERLEEDLRVVGRAPTKHGRARVHDVGIAARLQRCRIAEIERSLEQRQPLAQLQHLLKADVAGTRFEQADADVRVLREPRGNDRAGGSATNYPGNRRNGRFRSQPAIIQTVDHPFGVRR